MNNFILYQCVIALCLSLSSLLAQSVEQKDKEFSMVCGSSKPKLFTNYKLQASSGKNLRVSQGVYKIPAVVHVISSTDCPPLSSERYRDFPTDGLIRAEIKEASQRFRHMHPSAEIYANPFYGADTEIELELTTVDPNGKFTSGINRIVDANAEGQSWTSLHAIINKYKWDTTKYCNIFVVKGMPDASGVYVYEGDFTVLNTTSFWSGLLNHELGHYLGLMHIFQTDIGSSSCPSNDNCLISGDQICDTPPRSRAGDPSEICGKGDMIVNSCSTDEADISTNNPYRPVALGGMGDQPDMLANYMDYTGRCWDSYTLGQKNKMRMNLEWRKEILASSHSAFSQPQPQYYAHIKNLELEVNSCMGNYIPKIEIENRGTSNLTALSVGLLNNNVIATQLQWTGLIAPGTSQSISLPGISFREGWYSLKASITLKDQNSGSIYQTGMCREVHMDNPSGELFIPFTACSNFELGKIVNDKDLNWSTFKFGRWYSGYECRACVASMGRKEAAAYTSQNASFEINVRDFTKFDHPRLSFKLGYITVDKSGPYDTLLVNVAAPCKPFETIWKKTGLDLVTNNPPSYSTEMYGFYPSCLEYKDIVIDMDKYASVDGVRIQFKGQGKFIRVLFIDDIHVYNELPTAIAAPNHEKTLTIVNPVIDKLVVVNTHEYSTFQIFSLTGKLLLQTNSEEIDVSQLAPGVYMLAAQNETFWGIQKFFKN